MTKPLLDLSGKIDPTLIEVCRKVAHCTEALKIPYLVIGAFARDLVMHYGYGAPIQRATTDIDFALQVPSWAAFDALKAELVAHGLKQTKATHRLNSPNGWHIDIVPFGDVSDEHANIQWPPNGDEIMSVLGFQEALDNADHILLAQNPPLKIPVVSPVGLTILKFISWMERDQQMRNKDAKDLAYLFTNYETIPAISEALHADQSLMAKYDWDITLAAAHKLGIDAKQIASSTTATTISKLLKNQHSLLKIALLINEMSVFNPQQQSRNQELINAYKAGFL